MRVIRLLLVVAAVAQAGCFRGTLAARELYRLTIPDSVFSGPSTAGSGRLAGSIAIERYVSPGLYGDANLVYRVDENAYGAYPSREWAIPLADQLGVLTAAELQRRPLTTGGAVFHPPSPRSHPYLWRGTIREFEEVDRGTRVYASVHLDAMLVRTADDSVMWTGTARAERAVDTPTMAAIVASLSTLAASVVAELVDDASRTVAARSAAAAGRAP